MKIILKEADVEEEEEEEIGGRTKDSGIPEKRHRRGK